MWVSLVLTFDNVLRLFFSSWCCYWKSSCCKQPVAYFSFTINTKQGVWANGAAWSHQWAVKASCERGSKKLAQSHTLRWKSIVIAAGDYYFLLRWFQSYCIDVIILEHYRNQKKKVWSFLPSLQDWCSVCAAGWKPTATWTHHSHQQHRTWETAEHDRSRKSVLSPPH